jgi:hypothetical protein
MSAAGLFVLVGVSVGVAAFILWPLVFGAAAQAEIEAIAARDRALADAPASQTALQHQHQAILDELRAVEFDYQTGKLLAEDYQKDRARLVALGAETLRAIDALKNAPVKTAQRPKRRAARKS